MQPTKYTLIGTYNTNLLVIDPCLDCLKHVGNLASLAVVPNWPPDINMNSLN